MSTLTTLYGTSLIQRKIISASNGWIVGGAISSDRVALYQMLNTNQYAASPSTIVGIWAGSTTYYTSPNGLTWTSRTLPATPYGNRQSVNYGGGMFAYLSSSSQYRTSADGITWDAVRSLPVTLTDLNCKMLGQGGLLFLFNSTTTTYYTSANGTSWTSRTSPVNSGVSSTISYANGKFIGFFSGTTLYTSSDGISWTDVTAQIPYQTTGASNITMAYNSTEAVWVVLLSQGSATAYADVYISSDFSTWTYAKNITQFATITGLPTLLSNGSVILANTTGMYKSDPYGNFSLITDNGLSPGLLNTRSNFPPLEFNEKLFTNFVSATQTGMIDFKNAYELVAEKV